MRISYFIGLLAFLLLTITPIEASISRPNDGELHLFNLHLKEEIKIKYRDGNTYDEDALEKIRNVLRCRMTQQEHEISVELIELIDQIQDHFEADVVQVISAYRSPYMNETLRRNGRKVAKYSRHMHGEAMDIRLPGVPVRKLRDYALSLKQGGVGYYPGPNFVHIDVGQFRTW